MNDHEKRLVFCLFAGPMTTSSALLRTSSLTRIGRILLVDDEPHVLRGLVRALGVLRSDWFVHGAESGNEALRLLDTAAWDIVLTDLEMPHMGGLELLATAKQRFPRVRRIVHSACIDAIAPERLSSLAHAVLRKPCAVAELVGALDHVLAEKRHAHDLGLAQAG